MTNQEHDNAPFPSEELRKEALTIYELAFQKAPLGEWFDTKTDHIIRAALSTPAKPGPSVDVEAVQKGEKALNFLVDMAHDAVHHHMQNGSVERAEKDVREALRLLSSIEQPAPRKVWTREEIVQAIWEGWHPYRNHEDNIPDRVADALIAAGIIEVTK